MGGLWGGALAYYEKRDAPPAERRAFAVRAVPRMALDLAGFMSIWTAVYCAVSRASKDSEMSAAACAGAAGGTFIAARSSASPRVIGATALACSAVSIFIEQFNGGGYVVAEERLRKDTLD